MPFERKLPTTTFQSISDGFRVQVPNGWVVEDINSTEPRVQQTLRQYGVEYLAAMCPQNQALPAIGGLYSCPIQSPTAVGVTFYKFVDLHSRPELSALARQNKSITTSDLLALYFDYQRKFQAPGFFQNLQIVNNTDIAVNVTDSQTDQTIGKVPAKYVEYIHASTLGTGSYKKFVLLALSNDTNTAYVVDPIMLEGLESSREAPPFVRQVLDSFELVVTYTTPIATAPLTTLSSLQQLGQLLSQQESQQPAATAPLTEQQPTTTKNNTAETAETPPTGGNNGGSTNNNNSPLTQLQNLCNPPPCYTPPPQHRQPTDRSSKSDY